jgi:hypothetical protein
MKSAEGNKCEEEILKIVKCSKVDFSPQTKFACELAE